MITNLIFPYTISDDGSIIYDSNDVKALPTFIADVENKTVIAGRTAILKCAVKNLGNYKVSSSVKFQNK